MSYTPKDHMIPLKILLPHPPVLRLVPYSQNCGSKHLAYEEIWHADDKRSTADLPIPGNKPQHHSLEFSSCIKGCESDECRFLMKRRDEITLRNPVVTKSLRSCYSVLRIHC